MLSLRVVALMVVLAATGAAQSGASGAIVCWKDKAGKTVGCGDKIPPEYQDNASNQLNQRGVTIKQNEAALTPEQKRALQAEAERKKVEDARKEELRRSDKALLDTFTTVQEIDLKLAREVQLIGASIETLRSNLQNNSERMADVNARAAQYTKSNRPVPVPLEDEIKRTANDRAKTEGQIAQKGKDIEALKLKYAAYKQRFAEISTGAAAPVTTARPAAGAPPAKK